MSNNDPSTLRELAHWWIRMAEAGPEPGRLECLLTAADLDDLARRGERGAHHHRLARQAGGSR